MANAEAARVEHWDVQYREERPVWDLDQPSSELVRFFREQRIHPGRALEMGCGTGASSVWLAEQGFEVTGIDLSPTAIERARERAARSGVSAYFISGDLTEPGMLTGPFDFFLDCGCYHALRRKGTHGLFHMLERTTVPGTLGLVLTGNAHEPEDAEGPPVLQAEDIRREWSRLFEILWLREFRWDAPPGVKHYLGWSCLARRRPTSV